jgi:hypothetical protein
MKVPRSLQWLIAATLLCGLLSITFISRSTRSSRMLISVSEVEKEQRLDNQMSQRLADAELAKWDKLESDIFPDNMQQKMESSESSQAVKKAVKASAPVAATVSQVKSKPTVAPANFFSKGSGMYSTDARFRRHANGAHVPAHSQLASKPQAKPARTQKKALEVLPISISSITNNFFAVMIATSQL